MIKKVACFFLFCLLGPGLGRAQTVNCLVAFVNGEALTLTDLQIAQAFGLYDRDIIEGGSGDLRLAVLDALIDQKVVLEVARGPAAVGKDELSQALGALRDRLGPAIFRNKLSHFGLAEDDLRPYLADRIRFAKAVSTRFSAVIPVSRGDVEKFYREIYDPDERAKGLEPEPLESVLPGLEARVRDDLKARKVAEWVRTIRAQAEVRVNRDCLK
jgi:hypothetical protein